MAGHVFISHGSDNQDEATRLCAFIEGNGVKCWMAPRDVRPGTDYSEALQAAIEGCAAFVVLVTETANKSPYVRAETEMAFSNSKPILPVRLTEIKPAPGLAFFLKIRHWTDAFGAGREASLERLARELKALTGEDAAEAAPAAPMPLAAPAPPASAPTPAPLTPTPPSAADDELRAAAIGSNADYFLRKWAEMDAKGRSYDWNWAACFLNFGWFAYRKMWIVAAAVGVTYIVTTPLMDPANKMLMRNTLFVMIAISFLTGAFGNRLYRSQIDRLVAATAGMGRAEAIEQLKRRGGPSVPGLIGAIAAILLLGMGFSAVAPLLWNKTEPPAPSPGPSPPSPNPPAPEPPRAEGPPVLDQAYLVGHWADDGDCSRAFEFTTDGRFVSADGVSVDWRLDGNVVTLTGPTGSATMRLVPIDQNTMTATSAQGETSNPIRCDAT